MHVFADLRAGTDRRPGIDHRSFVDIRADVDVRRHQHHVFTDKRAAPSGSGRHHAKAAVAEIAAVVVGEFGRNLVVIIGESAFDEIIVFETEGQQHRFFQPLMRNPHAVFLAGDAQTAFVQFFDDVGDGVLEFSFGVMRGDVGAPFERGFDELL